MKILIVDDSKSSRDVLKFLIAKQKSDASVFEVGSGLEALTLLKNNAIDIMITDIKMPQMDGLELIEKARSFLPDLQIIVFSAFGNFDFAKKALRYGVTNYLLKPINATEFHETFATVLEKRSENQARLIWQYFDACTVNGTHETPPVPKAITDYSLLTMIYPHTCDEETMAKAHAFIMKANVHCLVRREKCALTILSQKNDKNRTPFDDKFYSLFSKEFPCAIYQCEFVASPASSYEAITEQRREDIFWNRPDRFCAVAETPSEKSNSFSAFFSAARRIERSILEKNCDPKSAINQLVDDMIEKSISSKQCKYVFFEIIKQLFGGLSSSMYYEQAIENITSAATINEVKQHFALILLSLNKTNPQMQSGEIGIVVRTAIEIIHTEYMNDLNRTDVAKRIYLSAPYFSHIFKKETGKSFTQYLNDFRMETACMLLKNTTHSIHAIAKMVGFTNYPYFCSQFKKKFGQTCIQYREKHFGKT